MSCCQASLLSKKSSRQSSLVNIALFQSISSILAATLPGLVRYACTISGSLSNSASMSLNFLFIMYNSPVIAFARSLNLSMSVLSTLFFSSSLFLI